MYFTVRELVFMTIISFCVIAREEIHYLATLDRRTTEQVAIMVPIFAGVLNQIGFSTLILIVNETELDLVLALLASEIIGEVD